MFILTNPAFSIRLSRTLGRPSSGQFKPFLFEGHLFALKNGFVGFDGHHGGFVALLIARSRLQFDSGEIFFQGNLEKYLAGIKLQPRAGYQEGYEAAVMAIKANEAILKGEKVAFKKEWFELA